MQAKKNKLTFLIAIFLVFLLIILIALSSLGFFQNKRKSFGEIQPEKISQRPLENCHYPSCFKYGYPSYCAFIIANQGFDIPTAIANKRFDIPTAIANQGFDIPTAIAFSI